MKAIVVTCSIVMLVILAITLTNEPSQAAPIAGQPRGYQTTPAELADIKKKADSGIEPYASSVKQLLDYAKQPWNFTFRSPELCENADSPAWLDNTGGTRILYAKALAYRLTGNTAYANEVKIILESIMVNVKEISLDMQQCQLNFGWYTPEIVASADLLEGYWNNMTCTGPTSTVYGQNQVGSGSCKTLFQNWLVKNPYYVVSYAAESSGSNWGAAATNALAYIADYLSDRSTVKLINRMPSELGGGTVAYTPSEAYARANKLAIDRMNGYRVDYQSSTACDYLTGSQQLSQYTPVKSQISEKGIIPEDARRQEYCNIPVYNGTYQNYPQVHLGNVIQQCELMRRRGSNACFDNIDMTDKPSFSFKASDGKTKTTHLYPGRGSVERAINAIIIDSNTEWSHSSALEIAFRYYATSNRFGKTGYWDDQLRTYLTCDQDACFGRLTHGGAVIPLSATPTPVTLASPTPIPLKSPTPAKTATPAGIASPTPVVGAGSTQTLAPSDDTMVKLAYPTSNYGTQTTLRVRDALPSDDHNTYLKFVVPSGVSVTRATLRLYVYDGSDKGGDIYKVANTLNGSTTAWTETKLTWNNAPAISGSPLSSVSTVKSNTWAEFDVTAAVTGAGTYSFAISNTSSDSVYYNARENASNKPQLVIQTGTTQLATATPASPLQTTPQATIVPGGTGTTKVLTPSDDTQVKLAYPTSNYGTQIALRVRNAAPSEHIVSYLKFVVPSGGTITGARLRLYAYDGSDDGGALYKVANTFNGSTTAWTETKLTWNNKPAFGGTPLGSAGKVSDNTWIEFDVKAAITGAGTYSFALSNNSSGSVYYYAKENGANAPQLVITYDGTLSLSHMPTATPTLVPVDQSLMVVEAESAQIAQSGAWTAYSTSLASGGQYVYSSGAANDSLTLRFEGSRLDVNYLKHPSLGSFAIEIDGAQTQVITATANSTIFGAKASVSGLAEGPHTARIVALQGTVALDAFGVVAVTVLTPGDTSLRIIESDAADVLARGSWTAHTTPQASGGRYLFSSGSTDDSLNLVFNGSHLEIVYITHPALGSFRILIDGVEYQAISSMTPDTRFDARVVLDGLGGGSHTLRIVPVSGVIAIDAFGVK